MASTNPQYTAEVIAAMREHLDGEWRANAGVGNDWTDPEDFPDADIIAAINQFETAGGGAAGFAEAHANGEL